MWDAGDIRHRHPHPPECLLGCAGVLVYVGIGLVVLVVVLFVGLILLMRAQDDPYHNWEPPPEVPAELLDLPADGLVKCHDTERRFPYGLSQYPGIEPVDPDSASHGRWGDQVGTVEGCSQVRVLECAWSGWDKWWWVYVRGPDGQEGWLEYSTIERMLP